MAMIDLENLKPEDIEALKSILGSTGGANRSPAWKPLKDMRPPQDPNPLKRLNRPHFEWSAYDDGNTVIKPFPKLYWDEKGIERLVATAEADKSVPETWQSSPPGKQAPIDPMVRLQAEFDALSPEDQAFVLEQQKAQRLKKIHELMAGLSEADLASLTPKTIEAAKTKKSA